MSVNGDRNSLDNEIQIKGVAFLLYREVNGKKEAVTDKKIKQLIGSVFEKQLDTCKINDCTKIRLNRDKISTFDSKGEQKETVITEQDDVIKKIFKFHHTPLVSEKPKLPRSSKQLSSEIDDSKLKTKPHRLKKPQVPKTIRIPKGIKNTGNSCFLNALIQMIRLTPLAATILNAEIDPSIKDDESTELLRLLKKMLGNPTENDIEVFAQFWKNKMEDKTKTSWTSWTSWLSNPTLKQDDSFLAFNMIIEKIARIIPEVRDSFSFTLSTQKIVPQQFTIQHSELITEYQDNEILQNLKTKKDITDYLNWLNENQKTKDPTGIKRTLAYLKLNYKSKNFTEKDNGEFFQYLRTINTDLKATLKTGSFAFEPKESAQTTLTLESYNELKGKNFISYNSALTCFEKEGSRNTYHMVGYNTKYTLITSPEILFVEVDHNNKEPPPESVSPFKSEYEYNLQSVLIKSGGQHGGHWTCLKKIGDSWYYYDDDRCKKIADFRNFFTQNHHLRPVKCCYQQGSPRVIDLTE